MKQEIVNIEDVYPDENNPRTKFDGIERLAASFDLNTERPGEPFTPPILVKDGGIYRIVDGERRYRALKQRRASHFTAYVAESLSEANTMAIMLSTDDKQPLSELEKSRGTQLMLLLGVDPVTVDKAANINSSARIKKAMAKVDDAAKDMTIDRLLAIEEFADDQEVVEKLTNASEDTWETILATARRDREARKELQAMQAVLEKFTIPLLSKQPEYSEYRYMTFVMSAGSLEENISVAQKMGRELAAWNKGRGLELYYKRQTGTISEEDQAAEAAQEELARIKDLITESEERRMAWFAERLDEPEKMPQLAALAEKAFREKNQRDLELFQNDYLVDVSCTPCKLVLMVGFNFDNSSFRFHADGLRKGCKFASWEEHSLNKQKATIAAFKADGYQPEEWEEEIFSWIENAVVDEN